MSVNRYKNLITEVNKCKPSTIVEIGTWNGHNAAKMIRAANTHNSAIVYHGFDIFEGIDPVTRQKERHTKSVITGSAAESFLKGTGAKIILHKGYTNATLPAFAPETPLDFIYIDGGHSLDTIDNDWLYLSKFMHKKTVVLFDDCYDDEYGSGCFSLIMKLKNDKKYNVELLDPVDTILEDKTQKYDPPLKVRMVKVILNT